MADLGSQVEVLWKVNAVVTLVSSCLIQLENSAGMLWMSLFRLQSS